MNNQLSQHVDSHNLNSIKRLVPVILDVLLPVIGYYVPRVLGAAPLTSVIFSSIFSGLYVLYTLLARRKLDQFGILILGMLLLGLLLLFITGDARLALAKPAAFVFFAAVAIFLTLRKRPAILSFAKPMATDGDEKLELLWEQSWQTSKTFRRAIIKSTAIFGFALLFDAVGRIIIAYTVPIDKAVALANLPGLVAIILAVRFHLKTVKPVFHDIKQTNK